MTPEEKILAKRNLHPDWPAWKISKSLGSAKAGYSVQVIESVLAVSPAPAAQPADPSNGMIDVKTLVAKYDTRSAIHAAISDLPPGKIMIEADLCRLAVGSDRYRFNRTVENCAKEFGPMKLKIKLDRDREPVWVWGHPQDIEELKKAVNPWS